MVTVKINLKTHEHEIIDAYDAPDDLTEEQARKIFSQYIAGIIVEEMNGNQNVATQYDKRPPIAATMAT